MHMECTTAKNLSEVINRLRPSYDGGRKPQQSLSSAHPDINHIIVVTFQPVQLTQAPFLQKKRNRRYSDPKARNG